MSRRSSQRDIAIERENPRRRPQKTKDCTAYPGHQRSKRIRRAALGKTPTVPDFACHQQNGDHRHSDQPMVDQIESADIERHGIFLAEARACLPKVGTGFGKKTCFIKELGR